jgi:hypothetical protein
LHGRVRVAKVLRAMTGRMKGDHLGAWKIIVRGQGLVLVGKGRLGTGFPTRNGEKGLDKARKPLEKPYEKRASSIWVCDLACIFEPPASV